MRVIVILLISFLIGALAAPALAQPAGSETDRAVAEFRSQAKDILMQSREVLIEVYDQAKNLTGLSDEELYGAGVGLLAGFVVADFLGAAGLVSLATVGVGGYLGHWVVTDEQP